jgi:hypothetical protein
MSKWVKSFGEASTKQVIFSLFAIVHLGQEGFHHYEVRVPSQAIDIVAAIATITCNGSSNNMNNINFSGLALAPGIPIEKDAITTVSSRNKKGTWQW